MAIKKVLAQLSCHDLAASTKWYEALFGRVPDAQPMDGLAEWHHDHSAGLQLFENPKDAGRGTLTLIVSRLGEERRRLETAGLKPGEVEPATSVSVVRLSDPDGNLVVLAQPDGL